MGYSDYGEENIGFGVWMVLIIIINIIIFDLSGKGY